MRGLMFWRRMTSDVSLSAEGSLLVAIGNALDSVCEGARDDEEHALYCNKLVRNLLDKRAITYEEYRLWRKKNSSVFTTVVDRENNLIGFFDVFPLTSEAGKSIIEGRLSERSLSLDHILPEQANGSATHIHIATIL